MDAKIAEFINNELFERNFTHIGPPFCAFVDIKFK